MSDEAKPNPLAGLSAEELLARFSPEQWAVSTLRLDLVVAEIARRLAERRERERYEAALQQIANHPHNNYAHSENGEGQYGIGTTDGHRCAAKLARAALDLTDRRGIKHEWHRIDEDIQQEIRDAWAALIAARIREGGETKP